MKKILLSKRTKVLLLQNVPGQGKAGDLLDVADAYARNFLIPQDLAKPATNETIAAAQAKQRKQELVTAQNQAAIQSAKQRLDGQTVALEGAANVKGTLFAALKPADLLSALQRQFNVPDAVLQFSPDHLKTVGSRPLKVLWPDGTTTVIIVSVAAKHQSPRVEG